MEEKAEPNPWQEMLRKMLPEGAPLPDEEQLDYSISVDYTGSSPFSSPPIFNTISTPKTKFTTYPKHHLLLMPHKWKSPIDCDKKRYSASSINISIDKSSEVGGVEVRDFENLSRPGDRDEEKEMKPVEEVANNGRVCRRCGKEGSGFLKRRNGCRCIVCGSKYCKKCVLKAMGSMPEGRKCVGCIGEPIDEKNRGKLGKGFGYLARVCGELEVKQVMEREIECKANRVRPEQVTVNGRQLREKELDLLMQCLIPPTSLKPGRYWYDKESGLWGKEGDKPGTIISSKLDVGGKLQTGASNGSTRVYMNGREITTVELRVLKLAKVQCPHDTHFWLYEDGSYEEEGQNNIKGCIWAKASIRFLSSLFSLPVPPKSAYCSKEKHASSSTRLLGQYMEQNLVRKLLLLGVDESATSTIFKQVKFIYSIKYNADELQNIKFIILSSMYRYIGILLEGREQFEKEELMNVKTVDLSACLSVPAEMENDGSRKCFFSVNQKMKHFSDWFLDIIANENRDTYFPAAAREYAPVIDEIWKDPAIQETYKRREELPCLPDVAKYFLDRVIEISSNEYEPSETDILFAEDITPSNGLASTEFSFDSHCVISEIYNENIQSQQSLSKYQLLQLSSTGLHDGCKWLEMFEGMHAILFCVSLCDYDRTWTDHTGFRQNKMLASRDFFENVARQSCFECTSFVLLLNKYDLFRDKVGMVPLTVCEWFREFNPLKTHGKSPSLANQAYYYIAVKFKERYTSITGKKLYVSKIRGHERTSIDEAFRYVHEILEWEEQKNKQTYEGTSDEYSVSTAGISPSS